MEVKQTKQQSEVKEMTKKVDAGTQFAEILTKLEQEHKTREDLIYPVASLHMDESLQLNTIDGRKLQLGENSFNQLSAMLGMPANYLMKLAEGNKELVADQFNFFMKQIEKDEKRMFRLKNGLVQGVVGDRYQPFDNFELVQTFLENSVRFPEYQMVHYHENDKNFVMRFAYPDYQEIMGTSKESQKQDIVRVGIDITNSETGFGRVQLTPVTWRLVCTNGMRRMTKENSNMLKQRHIHFDPSELQRDIRVKMSTSLESARTLLTAMKDLKKKEVELPYDEINRLGKQLKLSIKQIRDVEDCYNVDQESNMYGIVNAFTRFARDLGEVNEKNDLRQEIEEFAGNLVLA